MKLINLDSGEYAMLQYIPKGAPVWIESFKDMPNLLKWDMLDQTNNGVFLPPGNWVIIGRGDELTEEEWWKIVDHDNGYGRFPHKNYLKENSWFTKNTPSGHSLIQSYGMKPQGTLILKKQ